MTRSTLMLAALALAVSAPLVAAPALAGPPHCPPGHAKKGWCSPGPRYDGPRWSRGDRIPRDRYVVIEEYDRFGYSRPPSGHAYVRVDDRVFLIALGTGLIIDALR